MCKAALQRFIKINLSFNSWNSYDISTLTQDSISIISRNSLETES